MITQNILKEWMEYNQSTGIFKRIKDARRGNQKIGCIAGYIDVSTGYIRISINRYKYYAHRLAVLYMTGDMPALEVDHINHVKDDNRWCNLREVTKQINMRNCTLSLRNTSGTVGVTWSKQRKLWVAQINIGIKTINLGGFKKKCDAIEMRKQAESEYNFHVNHGVKNVTNR